MSIYITGDIHGTHNFDKLNIGYFSDQKKLTKNDYLIILGDFGLLWNVEKTFYLDGLEDRNFTTLFIDGNHEDFDLLYKYPVVEFLGGKTHQIRPSIYHLMRGEVFTIEGLKFFAFGGGISIDKMYRVEGVSWWSQEIPNSEEIENGYQNLEKNNWTVDYVLTHAAPSDISLKILSHHCETDEVTRILDWFQESIICKKWFFGHHHIDKKIDDKYQVFYNRIERIK